MKYPSQESTTLEFKREIPRNDQIIKTIIGFCNQNGGQLIIGIADDGTIVGISEQSIEMTMETIERDIFDACMPPIIPRVSTQKIGDKRVIVIEVSEGMNKPYHRRCDGLLKGTYIRLGTHTAKATQEMIKELEWQSRGIDFEGMPVYQATKADLDLKGFATFIKNRSTGAKSKISEETLKAYNIITHEHTKIYPTTLGILLFGRNPQQFFTEAMIICTHFRGIVGRDAIATLDCEGNLFDQFEKAFAFIVDRLYKSFQIKGLKREEQLEVPEVAIRETLLNLIVHRNYYIKSPSKIAIYDDRIEIFSPGQFPGPLNTNDLLHGISYLRNPMLCKIMRESGFIEKLGSGFIEIFNSYEKSNLISPTVIEGENYIKCILPRLIKNNVENPLDDTEKLKKLFMRGEELSMSDVILNLSISRSTALRRLNEMVALGLIEKIGTKKSVRYRRCL